MSSSDDESAAAATAPKTASAYYDWAADKAKRKAELETLGVDITPKAVVGAAPAVQAQTSVGSAWNSAGTWEERDVTSRAVAHMKTSVAALQAPASSGFTLVVSEVTTCDGTVSLVFSRGKAKPGFEISLRVEWQLLPAGGEGGEAVASGHAFMDDISDSEGSDVFGRMSVECTTASEPLDRATARASVQANAEAFRKVLREWVEAVKLM